VLRWKRQYGCNNNDRTRAQSDLIAELGQQHHHKPAWGAKTRLFKIVMAVIVVAVVIVSLLLRLDEYSSFCVASETTQHYVC
jgi:hypothetical protein